MVWKCWSKRIIVFLNEKMIPHQNVKIVGPLAHFFHHPHLGNDVHDDGI
jgi:predicted lipoprotein